MLQTRYLPLFLFAFTTASAATRSFDVVVYGGTAGGAIAALTAAREGLKTALLEPTGHIGGMVSSGLGYTDYGKKEVIGGYAYEFYFRVGRHYQISQYGNEVSWLHEPHVAEQILREMLSGAGVQLFEHTRLKENNAVRRNGTRIEAIETENSGSFAAGVFIDSTYEGDPDGSGWRHLDLRTGIQPAIWRIARRRERQNPVPSVPRRCSGA